MFRNVKSFSDFSFLHRLKGDVYNFNLETSRRRNDRGTKKRLPQVSMPTFPNSCHLFSFLLISCLLSGSNAFLPRSSQLIRVWDRLKARSRWFGYLWRRKSGHSDDEFRSQEQKEEAFILMLLRDSEDKWKGSNEELDEGKPIWLFKKIWLEIRVRMKRRECQTFWQTCCLPNRHRVCPVFTSTASNSWCHYSGQKLHLIVFCPNKDYKSAEDQGNGDRRSRGVKADEMCDNLPGRERKL